MKFSRFKLATFAFFGFLLISCREEEKPLEGEIDVNLNSDQNVNYTIQGIVYNRAGNVPLSGVSVSVADTVVITNQNGIYTIPGLTIGSYLLTFEQTGFQTMVLQIGSDTFGSSNVVSSNAIFMYELTENLSMNFFYLTGELRTPAAEVPVTLSLGDPDLGFFENSLRTITTDVNGQLIVTNLPDEVINLEIETIVNEETYIYNNIGRIAGFNNMPSQMLNPVNNNSFFIIEGNLFDTNGEVVTDFDPTQDISLTFNRSIDPDYQFTLVNLTNLFSFNDVLIDFTIQDSTLTISPTDAILSEGTDYALGLQLSSIDGISRFDSFVFSTSGVAPNQLAAVTNLGLDIGTTITETTRFVTIQFTEVPNARSYEIYANYSEDEQNEFVRIAQFFPFDIDGDDLAEYSFSLARSGIFDPSGDGFFAPEGANYSIKVRALGSNGALGGFADLTIVLGDTGS